MPKPDSRQGRDECVRAERARKNRVTPLRRRKSVLRRATSVQGVHLPRPRLRSAGTNVQNSGACTRPQGVPSKGVTF